MTETNQGNPEVPSEAISEEAPYVIDATLAARLFWTGVVAGEQRHSGEELLADFVGCITATYPAVERHTEIQKLAATFRRVMGERKKRPSGAG